MALKSTLLNYIKNENTYIIDERYRLSLSAGDDTFILGDVKRAFIETNFTIEEGDSNGSVLVEDIDYEFTEKDDYYTAQEGENVWTKIKILNAAYYNAVVYITYRALHTYTDADFFNTMRDDVDNNTTDITALESQILTTKSKLTLQAGGFWGDILYKDADEIVIKPKPYDGIDAFIGCILNDGSFIELASDYTIKYDIPGNSGHIIDGITGKLNNEWFIVWGYEDSGGSLAFGITWQPYTTFSNANPTTTLTLNQVNSQDIGYLFPADSHIVVWQDTNELETPYGYADGGAFTYDLTNDTETSISSRTATVLTLGGTLNNTTFTASSTVYQVDGFKPLQVSDGAIASAIGSRGYKDIGFRFRTDGSGNIINFIVKDNEFYYEDGTGSASILIESNQGYGNHGTITTWTNYLELYVPPDKGAIMGLYYSVWSVYVKRYYSTYGTTIQSVGANSLSIHKQETKVTHRIFSAVNSTGSGGYNVTLGYIL